MFKFLLGAAVGASAIVLYAEKKGLELAFKLKEDLVQTFENIKNNQAQR